MKQFLVKGVIYIALFVLLTIVLWVIVLGEMPTIDDAKIVVRGVQGK